MSPGRGHLSVSVQPDRLPSCWGARVCVRLVGARAPGSREPPLKSLSQLDCAFIFVGVILFLLIPDLFFSSCFWAGNTKKQKKLGFVSGITCSL